MDNKTDENRTQTIVISECPRCHNKMIVQDRYCKSCGFDILAENEKEKLHFGKEDQITAVISNDVVAPSFNKQSRIKIDFYRRLRSLLMIILGVLSVFVIIMPILSTRNVFHYLDQVDDLYNVSIYESLRLDKNVNFIKIIQALNTFVNNADKGFNTSMMLFLYDLSIVLLLSAIVVNGIVLITFGIMSFINKKEFKYYLGIIGLDLIFSMILIFALNCYGLAPLIISISSLSLLIFCYISNLITKEKQFLLKNLIYKAISMSALLVILFISTFGMVKLDTITGSIMFNFEPMSDAILTSKNYFYCHGLILELMQFLQSSNGDEVFTSYTEILNTICFFAHLVYLITTVLAFNSLVKSLSKQSIRYPITNIVIATIFFYIFLTSLVLFDKIVNDLAYDIYLEDNNLFVEDSAMKKELYLKSSVFVNRLGLYGAITLSLPVCIFSVFARKACLKKKF